MKINKDSLQARINRMSRELGVNANTILAAYFFDGFIARLGKSKYADMFILKGGFYLSLVLGLQSRSTTDIDFLLRDERLDAANIASLFEDIIAMPMDDGISYEFVAISPIRKDDIYGGFNITLLSRLENIKQRISIDVSAGDPITPREVAYGYKRMFSGETLGIKAYNLETILAEKLQTILRRGAFNTRSKDFYDVYIIYKLKWDGVSKDQLAQAFEKTCEHRSTTFTKEAMSGITENLDKDTNLKTRWMSFSKKNDYAREIPFEEIMFTIREVLKFVS